MGFHDISYSEISGSQPNSLKTLSLHNLKEDMALICGDK